MQTLTIETAKKEFEEKLKAKLQGLANLIAVNCINLADQINLINQIRTNIYEDLNQFQHAFLLIKSAEYFKIKFPEIDKWEWHPFQTSGDLEPDLRGYCKDKILVNVEATTAQNPRGKIDTGMKKTLFKLNKHIQGDNYYVIQTEKMLERAKSKIKNNNLNIQTLLLS
jgi:hypothetical protein